MSDLKQHQFLLLEFWKFSSVQSLSHVGLFVTPWTAARQTSLSITKDWGTQSFFPNFMKINIIRIQNISSSKDRKGSPEEIHSLGNFCKTHLSEGSYPEYTGNSYNQSTGFLGGSEVKNLPAKAGDPSSISWSGKHPEEGNGYPPQYSCLQNPMHQGAWRATVLGVAKSPGHG